jgi:hypothetical protein
MAENNKPTGTPAMPMNTTASKYHWWYDAKKAGVANSPPANMTGRSPPSYSILSQSPPAGEIPDINRQRERRDSLKNLYHLSDFGTP